MLLALKLSAPEVIRTRQEPAVRILRAVESVLGAAQVRTRDLGGDATTTAVTEAILAAL